LASTRRIKSLRAQVFLTLYQPPDAGPGAVANRRHHPERTSGGRSTCTACAHGAQRDDVIALAIRHTLIMTIAA
jgi:hypothetical protein